MHDLLRTALAAGGFSVITASVVTVILFLSGLVSGLSGFAFSAVAACIVWLLPPLQAVPLVMLLSTCNQLLSVGSLRRDMRLLPDEDSEGALPFVIGGLVGVPLGLSFLRTLPVPQFAFALGLFLMVFSVYSLMKPAGLRVALSGWPPALVVGVLGGVVGGFSGFPGSMPVVYLGLLGKNKAETRGVVQPYILALQIVSLSILAYSQPAVFGKSFLSLFVLTLPAVLLGTTVGVSLYKRMSDINFRRAVLFLLLVSGGSLMAKTVIADASMNHHAQGRDRHTEYPRTTLSHFADEELGQFALRRNFDQTFWATAFNPNQAKNDVIALFQTSTPVGG